MLKTFANTWKNYNENGADGGEWLDLPMNEDDLEGRLENIAKNIGDDNPEWFFSDFEWDDCELLEIDENDDIREINEILSAIDDLNDYDLKKLYAIIDATGMCTRYALAELEDVTFWPNMTVLDVAYEYMEENVFTKNTPEILKKFFDYDSFALDMERNGYYETDIGTIYIWR